MEPEEERLHERTNTSQVGMGAAAAAAANIGPASCCFSPCLSFKKQRSRRTLNAIIQMASVQFLK